MLGLSTPTMAAPEPLGAMGRSSDLHEGVRGLVLRRQLDGPDPVADLAWRRFHATDAAVATLAGAAPLGSVAPARIRARSRVVARLEHRLVAVVEVGVTEPALAATDRLGDVYEATHEWLHDLVPSPFRDRALAEWQVTVATGREQDLQGAPAVLHAQARLQALTPR